MKKYLLIIFFLGIYLFPTSVLADTVVPKPSTSSWQDTLAGIASDVITLHNPVQLKNPKNNFSASEKPTFTLSIPTHTPDALGKFNSNIWKTKQENIKATITDTSGKVTTFSTDNNTIKRSSECAGDSYTPTPDYTANYQVNNPGVYKMHIVGKNDNGTHAIDDYFEVRDSVPFDVKRV